MKNLITSLCLFVFTLSFGQTSASQSPKTDKLLMAKDFGIIVEVDSAKELKETFLIEDINDLLSMTSENQKITLQIICNGEPMSNGKRSSLSYKIKGNTSKPEKFIASATKVRNAALKYYHSK